MATQNGRAERAPLIHRSTSVRAIYHPEDEEEKGISTARGTVIISSIGLLIFLQGRSFLFSLLNVHSRHPLCDVHLSPPFICEEDEDDALNDRRKSGINLICIEEV
jgi:hypothetical protein